MKKCKLALILLLLIAMAQARAGIVILRSDTWDYIAHVQIRQGNSSNPEMNQQVFDGPVQRGREFPSRDGVEQCYRRSGDPSNPTSPLAEWHCNARTISGSEYWSLD